MEGCVAMEGVVGVNVGWDMCLGGNSFSEKFSVHLFAI